MIQLVWITCEAFKEQGHRNGQKSYDGQSERIISSTNPSIMNTYC